MFGTTWETSEREYEVIVERDVAIPVDDDVDLVGDAFRPDTDDPVPVLLSASCYNTEFQSARITPRRGSAQNAWIEAGDPYFYARRGYAHVIVNVRGTGKSDGGFRNLGPREIEDVVAAIEWLADRPWCDGSVGMTGISYFGMIQPFVAMHEPEPLEAIFCPWAATDLYRDWYYQGGIFQHGFTYKWSQQIDNPRCYSWSRNNLNDEEFDRRVAEALTDEEIRAHPELVEALEKPDGGGVNPLLVDAIINRLDEPGGYFDERRVSYENTSVPAYHGADWGHTHAHLPAAFRNWANWEGPTKLLVGPPEFADRPFYQLAYQSLRWFDRWLKGRETGIMDEPEIRLFRMGLGTWKEPREWPLPETRWTPFYLHPDGLLYERDHFPDDGFDVIEDSPFGRGELTYTSPPLVERTEVMGPIELSLYAATTDPEALFFATLFRVDESGETTELTHGWLRASQRRADEERSDRWQVHHPHEERQPVDPGEVIHYRLNLKPTGAVFASGERIGLRLSCSDAGGTGDGDITDEGGIAHAGIRRIRSRGDHLARQSASRVTIYHDDEYPSNLVLPVTEGNVLGTFRSGGRSLDVDERLPYQKVWTDERPSE